MAFSLNDDNQYIRLKTRKFQKAIRKFLKHKVLINSICFGRCTVFERYMYSICTLLKRTYTVHILYKYCTYDGEGIGKNGGIQKWGKWLKTHRIRLLCQKYTQNRVG